ncbi:MAG TPA: hypothetical protein VH638_10165 [Gemmatimonadaceae bacterium]|jgi:hypothetical protein
MATETREALLLALPAAEAEAALDGVLAERGFERADAPPPPRAEPIARSEERFFDVDAVQPELTLIREWTGYADATAWGAALELAEGLPPAARMEMALPPALSVLARSLSRRATVVGFASRAKPWHLVGVVFRSGRAVDVITAVKDRVAVGSSGQAQARPPSDAGAYLHEWLAPHGVNSETVELLLGARDLPARWRVVYLHA